MNSIKLMETNPTVHSVKAILDELNYLAFTIRANLPKDIQERKDVELLFGHIYPGYVIVQYKEIFGDPVPAMIRKKFTKEAKCDAGGKTSAGKLLMDIFKALEEDAKKIPDPKQPVTPEAPKAAEAKPAEEKPQADEEVKFGVFNLKEPADYDRNKGSW